ncbi:MAG: recombinase family protein [Phreatobacter sp.]|uniref:recombinase family protein n=1 Tax=Phreatobacter sp. TaxID=1966341 RepID=UPI001A58BE83|nr:recombinase family protein [Phreatobacter sp.]
MSRVAIYARYSSDLQSPSSVDDQIRVLREKAAKEGWTIVGIHADRAISGASLLLRPGMQQLMQDVIGRRVDIVLSEALDRFSRDQEDIAGFFKRAEFAQVRLHTLSEGDINHLHIGLKGTMNALYLKDMKDKVKRGQRGRVENGKMGGGNCFGYDVLRRLDSRGEIIRGERAINGGQAAVVERIFREYADGKSPKAIAAQLNREGVHAPTQSAWQPSTIYGNWQRGAGILNNELYVGQIVWNKVSYPKDPDTGKHVTRRNPPSEWVRKEVPELRIIDQELWDRVKERQLATRHSHKLFWQHQRPRNLLSHLLKCGMCGGGMSKVSSGHFACSTARNKGEALCTNKRTVRQDALEHTVLEIIQNNLMDEKLVAAFCEEYTAHINRLRMQHNATISSYRAELERLARRQKRLIDIMVEGVVTPALREESNGIAAREAELSALLSTTKDAPVLFHPNMASRYRREVTELVATLKDESHRAEVSKIIRGLIERIVLTPDPVLNSLRVNLYGDLAGILNIALGKQGVKTSQEADFKEIKLVVGLNGPVTLERSVKVVGPAGLEPATKRL